jgi:pyrimidine-nucleoside phosphorylase
MSPKAGFISSMQCEQIGTACVILGGGRERKEDSVDPAVGIVLHKKVGDRVSAGESLATIHYNSEARAERAHRLIAESIQIAGGAPPKRPLIHRVIQKSGDQH